MSFDFDDFDVRSRFVDIDERTEELEALLADMPNERAAFEGKCKIAYMYHDSALDGVVLTYHELRAAIDLKVMSDTTLIPTYQQIKNHSEAIIRVETRALEDFKKKSRARLPKVTVEEAFDLHRLLNRELPRKKPGELRKDMPLHRTYFHTIHDPDSIEQGLKDAVAMVTDPDFRAQHPINQACLFHHAFMSVFPFSHDAGKIGRLIMNYFLIRSGYLPAVIHACDRQRYYESLKNGPEALRLLVIDSMEAALETGTRYLHERFSNQVSSRSRMRAGMR